MDSNFSSNNGKKFEDYFGHSKTTYYGGVEKLSTVFYTIKTLYLILVSFFKCISFCKNRANRNKWIEEFCCYFMLQFLGKFQFIVQQPLIAFSNTWVSNLRYFLREKVVEKTVAPCFLSKWRQYSDKIDLSFYRQQELAIELKNFSTHHFIFHS